MNRLASRGGASAPARPVGPSPTRLPSLASDRRLWLGWSHASQHGPHTVAGFRLLSESGKPVAVKGGR